MEDKEKEIKNARRKLIFSLAKDMYRSGWPSHLKTINESVKENNTKIEARHLSDSGKSSRNRMTPEELKDLQEEQLTGKDKIWNTISTQMAARCIECSVKFFEVWDRVKKEKGI